MMTARPTKAVANPTAVSTAIRAAQSNIAGLLRSTALMLEMQAVIMSTSRSAIIGNDTAAVAKVSAAKTVPMAEPYARYSNSMAVSFASTGKKALSIIPARDHTSRITSCANANTPAWPATRRASTKDCRNEGVRPAPSSLLTQYSPTAISGATNTKPESKAASKANLPSDHASADTATLTSMMIMPKISDRRGERLKSCQPSRSQRQGASSDSWAQGTTKGRSSSGCNCGFSTIGSLTEIDRVMT